MRCGSSGVERRVWAGNIALGIEERDGDELRIVRRADTERVRDLLPAKSHANRRWGARLVGRAARRGRGYTYEAQRYHCSVSGWFGVSGAGQVWSLFGIFGSVLCAYSAYSLGCCEWRIPLVDVGAKSLWQDG